jgi:acetyl-CoA carboxylase biotin carboxyl carrier protein
VKIDFDQIRELLAVVGQTDISELTIESGDEKITVRKAAPVSSPALTTIEVPVRTGQYFAQEPSNSPPPAPPAAATPAPPAEEANANNGLVPIASPMVGTFYRSPSPSAPPFLDVGDKVTVGQTVCIIEAMKLMNDLPSEVSGKVVRICVENGTTVEYGQPLFMVDPKG